MTQYPGPDPEPEPDSEPKREPDSDPAQDPDVFKSRIRIRSNIVWIRNTELL
jgi:hypothetical protein